MPQVNLKEFNFGDISIFQISIFIYYAHAQWQVPTNSPINDYCKNY